MKAKLREIKETLRRLRQTPIDKQEPPQGGLISVLLSNLYLHYVLDLRFERVVKVRLRGQAHLVRYIDDFVTSW